MNLREWALPVYTILLQMATGMLLVLWLMRSELMRRLDRPGVDKIFRKPVFVVMLTLVVAMIGSHFHLSSPVISFLAVLNLRASWLSREVFFTVLFFITTFLLFFFTWFYPGEKERLKTALGWVGVTLGILSILCMSICYQIPTQAAWNHPTTMLLFYCSALVLGMISTFTILLMDAIFCRQIEPELAAERYRILKYASSKLTVMMLIIVVLIIISNLMRISEYRAISHDDAIARATMNLILNVYRLLFDVRITTLLAGVGVFAFGPYWMIKHDRPLDELVFPAYLSCLLLLMGEILGRFLFYAAHIRMGV